MKSEARTLREIIANLQQHIDHIHAVYKSEAFGVLKEKVESAKKYSENLGKIQVAEQEKEKGLDKSGLNQ